MGDAYFYGRGVEQDWVRSAAIYYEAYQVGEKQGVMCHHVRVRSERGSEADDRGMVESWRCRRAACAPWGADYDLGTGMTWSCWDVEATGLDARGQGLPTPLGSGEKSCIASRWFDRSVTSARGDAARAWLDLLVKSLMGYGQRVLVCQVLFVACKSPNCCAWRGAWASAAHALHVLSWCVAGAQPRGHVQPGIYA